MNRDQGSLSPGEPLRPDVLGEILAGGQTFLWRREETADVWVGIHRDRVYRLSASETGKLNWVLLHGNTHGAEAALKELFATDIDFEALADALPWRSDPVLRKAMTLCPGLRILRQPVEQTLLSFLLSPQKRIDQIRAGLLELSRRFGTPIGDGYVSPPGWKDLARRSESDLRACGIGYRAKGIHRTAAFLAREPDFLTRLTALPTADARHELMRLPGVGRKIADCVLLFGLGRLEAFPIDTWISRELRDAYHLIGFSEPQLQMFATGHFGRAAGLAQQFLFAAARRG